jgi:uncharacterized protein YbgA (DUF1722 family)/uncharacterized protein YbbK (DUF523 family)
MENAIKIGISQCLLGDHVRYDGGHKHDRFITGTLGAFLTFVPVCPEMECGLGVPRESMRLVGDPDSPRLLTTRTQQDHTDRMVKWAKNRVKELEKEDLCGFIFKSNSPSSGMERVKVYNDSGMPVKKGVGMFARIFMDHFPLIPTEEEGRLHDLVLRENFIERVFTLKRWRDLLSEKKGMGKIVAFHTHNKLLIRAHSEQHYRKLGKWVAEGKRIPIEELYTRYSETLMEALKLKSTRQKNANVLQHMMGYFKKRLSSDEKQELLEIFDQYRLGDIPLIVPVTILKHYVRKYNEPYLAQQTYINPHPISLQLRNHA